LRDDGFYKNETVYLLKERERFGNIYKQNIFLEIILVVFIRIKHNIFLERERINSFYKNKIEYLVREIEYI